VLNGTDYCRIKNNIFAGPGTVFSGTVTTMDSSNNWVGTISGAVFINPGLYNFDILNTSPVINGGVNPGMAGSYSLTPTYEYNDTAQAVARNVSGALDIGAYEFGSISQGVAEMTSKSSFIVYPNPGRGVFSVVLDNKNVELLRVYDLSGKIVRSYAAAKQVEIDIQDQPAGVYFLRADDGVGERLLLVK
jgi:hypothetical protein